MFLYTLNYKIIFTFFLIIHLFVYNNSNEVYKIPFSLFKNKESINLVYNIFDALAYINLTIGTPPKNIPFQLNVNSQGFYISHNYFNPNESSTYELISNEEISYKTEQGTSGFKSKDMININDIQKKIDFIYETKNQKDNDLSNIGLIVPNTIQEEVYPFFTSLKRAGIINSYSWTLKYFNNISLFDTIYTYPKEKKIIGEFIIGDEPHNYEKNKNVYNENEFIKINAMSVGTSIYWDIYFDSLYMKFKDDKNDSKIIIEGNHFTEINPDIGFIVAPNVFFRDIQTKFFSKFKKICNERFLTDTYFRYIECDKNEGFDISLFPDLYFENKQLETIFNLTYEDLFILDETNNKYIFLIFNNRFTATWVFGSIFLKKYQLVFNVDSKTIGYYKSMNNYKDNSENHGNDSGKKNDYNNDNNDNSDNNEDKKEIIDNNDDNNKNKNNIDNKNGNNNKNQWIFYIIGGFLFLIISFLLILLGIYIQKKYNFCKRRKRINELEDESNDFNDEPTNDSLLVRSEKYKNRNENINNNYNIN